MSDVPKNGMMYKYKNKFKGISMKNTNQKDMNQKKKMTSRQVVAMVGVVLLILMYIVTLVVAIVDNSASGKYFAVCLACTFIIPIIIFLYSWMYGRASGKKVPGDPEKESVEAE